MGIVYMPKMVGHMVAPSNEKAIGAMPVGSLVKMTLGGKVWEWLIVQQGLPSSLYDSSCDGTWCLLKNCYERREWNRDVNDYANSTINAYLNGPWFNLLAPSIQKQVKQVKIPYRPGAGISSNVNSGAAGLLTRPFLLSGYEVGFTITNVGKQIPIDGAKLAYFPNNSGSNTKRVANEGQSGGPTDWALRSPYCADYGSGAIILVNTVGEYNNFYSSELYKWGIRPCIILPKTALVDKNGNVLEAK